MWDANGDPKKLDLAARTLADAIGILVSAALLAVAAYLLKKGGEALAKTKFAQTVGETRLAEWLKERQELQTTKAVLRTSVEIDYFKPLSSSGFASSFDRPGFGVFEGRIPGIKDPVAIKVYPEGHPVFAHDLAGAQAASRTGYAAKFYGAVPAGPGKRAFAMEKGARLISGCAERGQRGRDRRGGPGCRQCHHQDRDRHTDLWPEAAR